MRKTAYTVAVLLCCWIVVSCECDNPVGNPRGHRFEFINKTYGVGAIDIRVIARDDGMSFWIYGLEYGYMSSQKVPADLFEIYDITFIIPRYQNGHQCFELRHYEDIYVVPESGENGLIEMMSPEGVNRYDWEWIEIDPPMR